MASTKNQILLLLQKKPSGPIIFYENLRGIRFYNSHIISVLLNIRNYFLTHYHSHHGLSITSKDTRARVVSDRTYCVTDYYITESAVITMVQSVASQHRLYISPQVTT